MEEILMHHATDLIAGLIALLLLLSAYFLPTLVAWWREHPSENSIAVINFFFGWTFLGWVLALAWSVSSIEKKSRDAMMRN
jgi:Superinfection immunity protein